MKAHILNLALVGVLSANAVASFLRASPDDWMRFEMLWYGGATLVLIALSLFRSPARALDASTTMLLICAVSFYYPLAYSPNNPRNISTALVYARIAVQVLSDAALLCLGRSFAILPAYRHIVVAGPYTVVRHPVYSLYMCGDVLIVCACPSLWNAVIALVGGSTYVYRALAEERLLRSDVRYRDYANRVRWMFVPFFV